MVLANKESQERDFKLKREIKQLLTDHDNTYAHTMTSLEKRLDPKVGLTMRKLDELLSSSNLENCHAPAENSCQATGEDGASIMQGPSRDQEPALNLTMGRDTRQSH